MSDRIIAACDGAAKGNPGPAGWAWVIADPLGRPERWESGPLGRSTNNIGELTALERLLEAVDPGTSMEVRMDSQYAMKAVTQWLPNWKRNGWKTAAGKPVANRELVEHIDELLADRDVEFRYVPAHREDGDHLNAIADQAASDAAVTQQAAGTALGSTSMPVPAPARSAPSRRASTAPAKRAPSAAASRGGGPRPIKAKFRGNCPCGKPYAAGDLIAKLGTRWGHPDCRTSPAEAEGSTA
ncbi:MULTISPECIES: ribonuclease H [unclassified Streptomyces]|uniref:ribonuclease H family protein n=1 Tax=unclassified Streptomyces TaxID=2593676 RepID=UPI001BEC1D01|nr:MULTISPECIES: ribonuclease H [unclassified Streptomyces]MBT2408095.1 ribonuclease HI [Streptomyces sp. ISL-21]MBT2455795.1 ribonuclease HI [Streptomyces sp. ISL-86]MBT2609545.1 ribonuclease HI [Streptomyces sp. ISL-87]